MCETKRVRWILQRPTIDQQGQFTHTTYISARETILTAQPQGFQLYIHPDTILEGETWLLAAQDNAHWYYPYGVLQTACYPYLSSNISI